MSYSANPTWLNQIRHNPTMCQFSLIQYNANLVTIRHAQKLTDS